MTILFSSSSSVSLTLIILKIWRTFCGRFIIFYLNNFLVSPFDIVTCKIYVGFSSASEVTKTRVVPSSSIIGIFHLIMHYNIHRFHDRLSSLLIKFVHMTVQGVAKKYSFFTFRFKLPSQFTIIQDKASISKNMKIHQVRFLTLHISYRVFVVPGWRYTWLTVWQVVWTTYA